MNPISRLTRVCLLMLFTLTFSIPGASQAIPSSPAPAAPQLIPPLGDVKPPSYYVGSFGELQIPYYDEPTHLNFPGGLAVDGDRVWIAEYVGKRALLYNSDGTFVKKINRAMMYLEYVLAESNILCDIAVAPDHNVWLNFKGSLVKADPDGAYVGATSGGPQLSYNCKALAVDAAGNLFVSDQSSHIVAIYDSAGAYITSIGTLDQPGLGELEFATPANLAVRDGLLYVAELGTNRIQIIDVHDFNNITFVAFISDFQVNSDLDQFLQPNAVGVDANRIFVADSGNHRVLVFDRASLAYTGMIGIPGPSSGESSWNKPYDIAIDANGLIYVSDMNNHRVKQFSPSLLPLRTYGETGVAYTTDGLHFIFPNAVQADHQGNLYVAEGSARRVVKLSSSGAALFTLGESGISGNDAYHFSFPSGLAVDLLDNLYVADSGNHRIVVYNSSGTYLSEFGSQGSENDQFNSPSGVAIDPTNGDIYVVDNGNQRVQVFTAGWTYRGTIGVTGEAGLDNLHLNGPLDAAVDSTGYVYISDGQAARLQKCRLETTGYTCTTLVGETGVNGEPFTHFQNIQGVAVDANDLIYMVDLGMAVIEIYDADGRFSGSLGGGFLLPSDVTIAADGSAYVADSMNQRVQRYAPVDRDWTQVNVDYFGDPQLSGYPWMADYANQLYAAYFHPEGGQVWRMDTAGAWQQVAAAGIDDPNNAGFTSGAVFGGQLYLGSYNSLDASLQPSGGQIFRSDGAAWEKVATAGLGDAQNYAFKSMAVFSSTLYVGTSRGVISTTYTTYLGAQIWRSDSGDSGTWEKVLDFAALNPTSKNTSITELVQYNEQLYAIVHNPSSGAEIWRSADGSSWAPVAVNGLGFGSGLSISSAVVFGDSLYFGAGVNGQAAQIWRCQTCASILDFDLVMQGGFNLLDQDRDGYIDNARVSDLLSFGGSLYAWTKNNYHGSETWRSRDGSTWELFNTYGLSPNQNAAGVIFDNTLYAGGSETNVWQIQPRLEVFIAGSGSVASQPAGIDCNSACSAEFTPGSAITLTATAAPGATFTGWSGEGCSGAGACVVTAGDWRFVTASFTALANAANDPPATAQAAPPAVNTFSRSGVVGADLHFTPADFGANFTDSGGSPMLRLRITQLPLHGALKLGDKAVELNQLIPYDRLKDLFYQPTNGYSGSDSFSWNASNGLSYALEDAGVALAILPDADLDGAGDSLENGVPPLLPGGLAGDGNGDGLLDSTQSNVVSLTYTPYYASPVISASAAAVAPRYATLEIPAPLAFAGVFPMPYPAENPALPGASIFPLGFFELYIKNYTPGAAAVGSLYAPILPLPEKLLAFGAETGEVKFHWFDFASDGQTGAEVELRTDGRLEFTLHLVDGQRGDHDLTTNGLLKTIFGVGSPYQRIFLPMLSR